MTNKEQKVCVIDSRSQDDCKCGDNGQNCVNSRFTLAVIAIILSCFTGFFTIPMALAALILSLRAQDLAHDNRPEEAKRTAWWAGLFGWLTIGITVLPVIAVLFFGGTIMALLAAILSAA